MFVPERLMWWFAYRLMYQRLEEEPPPTLLA
jgi:hypothetical protein